MASQKIASDYDGVTRVITQMDSELDEIIANMTALQSTVDNTTGWQGIDALAYKASLRSFTRQLNNCSRWLKSLDNTLKRHSQRLYERALRDANAKRYE